MTKAISPLIATVVLVSFVIAIAIIVTSSFTTMTKTQVDKATKNSNCPGAILDIVSAKCNKTTNEIEIIVTNAGQIEIKNFSLITTIDGNLVVNSTTGGVTSLMPGNSGVITANLGRNGTISKIRVIAKNCPGLYVEKTNETASIASC